MVMSNVVRKKKLREVQQSTLNFIKGSLVNSFGPYGSNTCIKKDHTLNEYTKDGHTILQNIYFNGCIEHSVKEDLEAITRNIVKNVGDGTTSAIILSSIIFNELCKLENENVPFKIISDFKKAVAAITEVIKSNSRECTLEDIYNIAFTSTNGDEEIAGNLKVIYETYGMEVFIDVTTSIGNENIIKVYDGMTIEAPYADAAFINNTKEGVSNIRNPRIYAFEDPIDTPEMSAFLNTIINNNILKPIENGKDPIPTVIMCPKLSRDIVTLMDSLVEFMYRFDTNNMAKPPINIVTNIYDKELYMDIARLCGCPLIKKYINPVLQDQDIKKGLAPSPATICDFYGNADIVQSDVNRTKFVNPKLMHDKETGEDSNLFNSMVQALDAELQRAKNEGETSTVTGGLKRRLNSLKANMIEYLVGGITSADRDSKVALVEDAVLNCRSASQNGVGGAANYEGLIASYNIFDNIQEETTTGYDYMVKLICDAYLELSELLYSTAGIEDVHKTVSESLEKGCPLNLRTGEFDGTVITSIDSDIVILDGISKIIMIMFTCNQFLCQTPLHNGYILEEDLD